MTSSDSTAISSAAWDSLVCRSIEAWGSLVAEYRVMAEKSLQSCTSLEEFLSRKPSDLLFWFFQRRDAFLSQRTMTKWSGRCLDQYVLLPATNGFVRRTECIFVSHFWRSRDDPDPDGHYLRLIQGELEQQTWSYIWVDWTCVPQDPRSPAEALYFQRALQTMSGIIRNSCFMWYYPPFEPRLWILYEVAEYILTSEDKFRATPDIQEFADHVDEMVQAGVRSTLERHGYRCTYDRDKEFLTSWLEVLVLLRRQRVHLDDVRQLLDRVTWFPSTENIYMNSSSGLVRLHRFQGVLTLGGAQFAFTPFPQWEDGKFSANPASEPKSQ